MNKINLPFLNIRIEPAHLQTGDFSEGRVDI